MDRLSVDNHSSAVVYKFSKQYEYVMEPGYAGLDKFGVKTVDSSAQVRTLKNFHAQKSITESIFSKNENLYRPANGFSPDKAIVLKASGLFENSENAFYPCSNFSPSFDTASTVRPMVELQVLMGHAFMIFQTDKILPIKMALKLPVNPIEINYREIEGTQWCNWFELGRLNPHVKILSLKSDSFKENSYTGAFDMYEEFPTTLEHNVKRSMVYSLDQTQGTLKGTNNWVSDGRTYKSNVTFMMVEDSSGVKAMLKRGSESEIMSSLKIYYECADKRPLETFPDYKKGLSKLLELEMNH
jgi:hypothetical protein